MGVGNKPLMDIGGSNTITDRSVSVPDNSKHHFQLKLAQLAKPDPNQAQKIWTRSEPDPKNWDQTQMNMNQTQKSGPDPNLTQKSESVPDNLDQIKTTPEKLDEIRKIRTSSQLDCKIWSRPETVPKNLNQTRN